MAEEWQLLISTPSRPSILVAAGAVAVAERGTSAGKFGIGVMVAAIAGGVAIDSAAQDALTEIDKFLLEGNGVELEEIMEYRRSGVEALLHVALRSGDEGVRIHDAPFGPFSIGQHSMHPVTMHPELAIFLVVGGS